MSLSSYVFRDAAGTTQSRAAAVVSSAFVCANTLVDQSGNATPAGDAATDAASRHGSCARVADGDCG